MGSLVNICRSRCQKPLNALICMAAAILLTSCVDWPTPERKVKAFNEKNGPEITTDISGNLYLELLPSKETERSASQERLSMKIPAEYEPELSKVLERTIYIHITLDKLTDWTESPPIPRDVQQQARIYSSPLSLLKTEAPGDLPSEVKDDIYNHMELKRKRKRVRFKPDRKIHSSYAEWRKRRFYNTSKYIQDGFVDGLERYFRMYCFSDAQLRSNPNRPDDMRWKSWKYALENKRTDDPSPDNCVVDRSNMILVNKESDNSNDWIFIKCSPVIHLCTATIFVERRTVEVDLWLKDAERWRETLDPIRSTINSFTEAE